MSPENAFSATQSRCQRVGGDCLPVPCDVERRCSRLGAAGTQSRVQSSGRARESPLEIAAIAPGAKQPRAKQAQAAIRKYRVVVRLREESATVLLQSAT